MATKKQSTWGTYRASILTVSLTVGAVAGLAKCLGVPSYSELQPKTLATMQHDTISQRVDRLREGIQELKTGQQTIIQHILKQDSE